MSYKYPWSNTHELNLNWILNQLKAISSRITDITAEAESVAYTEEASVTVTPTENSYNLEFKIPRGAPGGGTVTSVNEVLPVNGNVTLDAEDVGALPDDTEIPTHLPTPNALTFTGASTATFDGSSAVTVNIPQGGSGTTDYSDLTNKPKINNVELTGNKTTSDLGIDIPTVLPNPNALTFTGAVVGSYDGSHAKTVNIPTQASLQIGIYALTLTYTSLASHNSTPIETNISSLISGLTQTSKIWVGGIGITSGITPSVLLTRSEIVYNSSENAWYLKSAIYNNSGAELSGTLIVYLYYAS